MILHFYSFQKNYSEGHKRRKNSLLTGVLKNTYAIKKHFQRQVHDKKKHFKVVAARATRRHTKSCQVTLNYIKMNHMSIS